MDRKVSEMGKCYRKKDNFALYKDQAGFLSVYQIFRDEDGEKIAMWRGYLAYPENFEVVVEELKYEDKLALKELEAEFGISVA